MRTLSRIGLAKLCAWFGISRQAYYNHNWRGFEIENKHHLVLSEVKSIREKHPRIGTRKLFYLLQNFFKEHQKKMGRDALFNLFYDNQLLIRNRKRKIRTTNSHHRFRKYPNLIRGLIPTEVNQLWVSDITYWKVKENHLYISFITDVFSHKIVGYYVSDTLATSESEKALKMALKAVKGKTTNLIHHSDRGIQYCSNSYVKLLQDYDVKISMTENGDPLENAVAERVNGIIKGEYLYEYKIDTLKQARRLLKVVVQLYNTERPHMSINNKTPELVHQNKQKVKFKRLWKNYYQKNSTIVKEEQTVEILQI